MRLAPSSLYWTWSEMLVFLSICELMFWMRFFNMFLYSSWSGSFSSACFEGVILFCQFWEKGAWWISYARKNDEVATRQKRFPGMLCPPAQTLPWDPEEGSRLLHASAPKLQELKTWHSTGGSVCPLEAQALHRWLWVNDCPQKSMLSIPSCPPTVCSP